MNDSSEMLHQLGAFEPAEAKKILPALEARGIAFEVEGDHSELGAPNRTLQLYFGMFPAGSKLAIFVKEPDLDQANEVVAKLFPV